MLQNNIKHNHALNLYFVSLHCIGGLLILFFVCIVLFVIWSLNQSINQRYDERMLR